MAKKSVTGGRGITGIQFSGKTQARVPSATRSDAMPRANQTVQKDTPYTNQPMVDKGKIAKTVNSFRQGIGAVANRYTAPIGPQNTGVVPGGRGVMALKSVRMKPTAGAPRASVTGAKVSPAGTTPKRSVGETIRTFVNEKLTPNRKSTPMRGTNLGVSSGKTTGKTVSRGGTGGRTTGGGRATGGGYSNAGPAGMGASGRGTGGKK